MKRCPKCGGNKFYATAHIVEDWLLDENGEYILTSDSCVEVAHYPDDEDVWQCVECGYDDNGYVFNIKEEEK